VNTRWLVLLSLLLAAPLRAAPDLVAPPHARVASVAGDTGALGMRLAIRRFESEQSPEAVLAFYRKRWKGRAAEAAMPPWRMIGRLVDGEYHNVQVQAAAGGGSWGYLSVSDLPRRARKGRYTLADLGKGFPRMGGSRVLDDQPSRDAGKRGRTLMLQNGFSVAGNAGFYRRHYQGQGWRLLLDEAVAARGRGQVLAFARRGERLLIAINRSDENTTTVVANLEQARVLPW